MNHKYIILVQHLWGWQVTHSVFDINNKPVILNNEQREKIDKIVTERAKNLKELGMLEKEDSFYIELNENFNLIP